MIDSFSNAEAKFRLSLQVASIITLIYSLLLYFKLFSFTSIEFIARLAAYATSFLISIELLFTIVLVLFVAHIISEKPADDYEERYIKNKQGGRRKFLKELSGHTINLIVFSVSLYLQLNSL